MRFSRLCERAFTCICTRAKRAGLEEGFHAKVSGNAITGFNSAGGSDIRETVE